MALKAGAGWPVSGSNSFWEQEIMTVVEVARKRESLEFALQKKEEVRRRVKLELGELLRAETDIAETEKELEGVERELRDKRLMREAVLKQLEPATGTE